MDASAPGFGALPLELLSSVIAFLEPLQQLRMRTLSSSFRQAVSISMGANIDVSGLLSASVLRVIDRQYCMRGSVDPAEYAELLESPHSVRYFRVMQSREGFVACCAVPVAAGSLVASLLGPGDSHSHSHSHGDGDASASHCSLLRMYAVDSALCAAALEHRLPLQSSATADAPLHLYASGGDGVTAAAEAARNLQGLLADAHLPPLLPLLAQMCRITGQHLRLLNLSECHADTAALVTAANAATGSSAGSSAVAVPVPVRGCRTLLMGCTLPYRTDSRYGPLAAVVPALFPSLTRLDISGADIHPTALQQLLQGLPQLRELVADRVAGSWNSAAAWYKQPAALKGGAATATGDSGYQYDTVGPCDHLFSTSPPHRLQRLRMVDTGRGCVAEMLASAARWFRGLTHLTLGLSPARHHITTTAPVTSYYPPGAAVEGACDCALLTLDPWMFVPDSIADTAEAWLQHAFGHDALMTAGSSGSMESASGVPSLGVASAPISKAHIVTDSVRCCWPPTPALTAPPAIVTDVHSLWQDATAGAVDAYSALPAVPTTGVWAAAFAALCASPAAASLQSLSIVGHVPISSGIIDMIRTRLLSLVACDITCCDPSRDDYYLRTQLPAPGIEARGAGAGTHLQHYIHHTVREDTDTFNHTAAQSLVAHMLGKGAAAAEVQLHSPFAVPCGRRQ